jgi:hypothetical protein
MSVDPDYRDGLMNVSGNIFRQEVKGQIEPFLRRRQDVEADLTSEDSAAWMMGRPVDHVDVDAP